MSATVLSIKVLNNKGGYTMNYENKKFTFDLLLCELENEQDYQTNSNEVKKLTQVALDFNKSYFKGIDQIANSIQINDILKEGGAR